MGAMPTRLPCCRFGPRGCRAPLPTVTARPPPRACVPHRRLRCRKAQQDQACLARAFAPRLNWALRPLPGGSLSTWLQPLPIALDPAPRRPSKADRWRRARGTHGGRIAPGDPLLSEEEFASQLGVNRSTIREALRVLEQRGLVRREPGRKKLVASIPRSYDISRPVSAAMILQQVSFGELWDAMYALEPPTASAAATEAPSGVIAALDVNLVATRSALDKVRASRLSTSSSTT